MTNYVIDLAYNRAYKFPAKNLIFKREDYLCKSKSNILLPLTLLLM